MNATKPEMLKIVRLVGNCAQSGNPRTHVLGRGNAKNGEEERAGQGNTKKGIEKGKARANQEGKGKGKARALQGKERKRARERDGCG